MPKQIQYTFVEITNCNMCGQSTLNHKVLGKRLNQTQGKNPQKLKGITTTVMQCSNCKLIYSNPQPVPVNLQDHYGMPPETYWKEIYFTVDDDYFKSEITTAKSLMQFKEGNTALDIGAGIGKCMIALNKAGFETYGCEPSEPFHSRAIEKMKIDPEKIKLGAAEEVEYPENFFDFITFGAVLEHLYCPSDSLAKAMKWLKPGGIIHCEVPSSNWWFNKAVNKYYRLRGMDYVANLSPMHIPYHLHEFNLKSFEENSRQHNYEIAFHQYFICERYMPAWVNRFFIPYLKRTNQGMQLCVWLRKK